MIEELNKIKSQAEKIKGQVDILSEAEKQGMNITPQTSIKEAINYLNNKKTSSSFDFTQNNLDTTLQNLNLSGDIKSLLSKISQPSSLMPNTEAAKQSLERQKASAIEMAKSFMETEQNKALSALGLKTGVGSLVLEGLFDIQRKNAATLANLASQYDTAIANLDFQTAQNVRNETMNLLNSMIQLENLRFNQKLTALSTGLQINTEKARQFTDVVSEIISNENIKRIDDLPESKKSIVEPLLSQIDKLSNLPLGTTKMKFDSMLSSGGKLQDAKIITTSGGGIYMFGVKNGEAVFEQLKGETLKQNTEIPYFNLDYSIEADLDSLNF